MQNYDIAIIGGGINGIGIARDAAGRGLKVFLCEQNDLASGTSSHSTKLIHGGLRYLEYYDFKLVRAALQERENLLRIAPHLIYPLQCIMPHHQKLRPAWLIRIGLFLYDHLNLKKTLPSTQTLDLSKHIAGQRLKPMFKKAFSYYDCFTNDARLVIANAKSARDLGAVISTYTKCIAIQTHQQQNKTVWHLTLNDTLNENETIITANVLINAAGPWVNEILAMATIDNQRIEKNAIRVKWVKGSHIIVPKLYEGSDARIMINDV